VRDAAMGLTSLGATVTPTAETWDDPYQDMFSVMAAFGPALGHAERASADTLAAGFEARGRADAKCRALLRDHQLLLSPTSQRVSRAVEEWDAFSHDPSFTPVYTADTFLFNWLKYPAVSVPCGFVDGLPVGLQIVGLPGREDLVFRAAQAFQQAFPREEQPSIS